MADRERDAGQTAPPWRGFHHVALVTPDLDATIRFYGEVLGMTVLADIPASARGGRHCLLAVDGDAGSFLHFFERADARIHPYPLAEGVVFPPELGALHHLAIALPDEEAGLALRARLVAAGVPVTEIMSQGSTIRDMLFPDNNGLLLEAAWPSTRRHSGTE
ncbi:MAG: hypothetical protein AVDCRST_MAG88-2254 [uncultured Thermomicrobiales bacterium]|uniref:VOC domain-containing protein n=1 Tax=uncultured Thermomicrobiales bacterium TaxID=1645740 RepID=A0A6J4VCA0_9BACT|nr:MAG: hypothetical protein AVDCRST_MAG88-2254 [uncultured Thermomicrobiales bacterium]